MPRNSTMILIVCLCACMYTKPLSATVFTDNGTANSYTLNTGDSLSIVSGTYTGTIISFAAGAKITVQSGAIFQPSSMAFPNVRGTITVYGQFKMNTQLRTNTGFTLHNYGITWVTTTTLLSGSTQSWNNYYGGWIILQGDVSITNDNAIINRGVIDCGANLVMTGTCSITNRNAINITGNYTNSGGTLTNLGRFQSTGSMTFNNGLALVYNHCRMIATRGIFNTTGSLYNYAYMWANANAGMGRVVNSGSIFNGPVARIHGQTLTNTGTITGSGFLYFTGTTTTTGSGTTGVSTITADTIKIYDVTRANPLTIYDNQTGIVHLNTIYRVFSAADSAVSVLGSCSMEAASEIPLAVQWNYFKLIVSNNIPKLTWSATYDAQTIFEIQRSYDGIDFYTIGTMNTEATRSVYNFIDEEVKSGNAIAYYRIKAMEPSGTQKYSVTRTARFTTSAGFMVYTTPNPFTSDLTIHYQSAGSGLVTIRITNLVGQPQLVKQLSVQDHFNSITISEAARLRSGMYIVQVICDNKIVGTQKIMKQ